MCELKHCHPREGGDPFLDLDLSNTLNILQIPMDSRLHGNDNVKVISIFHVPFGNSHIHNSQIHRLMAPSCKYTCREGNISIFLWNRKFSEFYLAGEFLHHLGKQVAKS